MIKTILSKGDQDYLYKLYESYVGVKDKGGVFKVAGKMIQKANKASKKELISIFDSIYEFINKERKVIRSLGEMEQEKNKCIYLINSLAQHHIAQYIQEYRAKLSTSLSEDLYRLIDDIKKGIEASKDENVVIALI
jgi:hypothetical protein